MKHVVAAASAMVLLATITLAAPKETGPVTEADTKPYTASYLVRMKDGMTFEKFRRHQLDVHVPLVLELPGLLEYRVTFFPPRDGERQPFDAMAQVAFESVEAHDAALASEAGQRALADLPEFVDTMETTVLAAGHGDVFDGHPTAR